MLYTNILYYKILSTFFTKNIIHLFSTVKYTKWFPICMNNEFLILKYSHTYKYSNVKYIHPIVQKCFSKPNVTDYQPFKISNIISSFLNELWINSPNTQYNWKLLISSA